MIALRIAKDALGVVTAVGLAGLAARQGIQIRNDWIPVRSRATLALIISACILMSSNGCMMTGVADKAVGRYIEDTIYTVESAYVAEDSDLLVCVLGVHNRRETPYWLRVPIEGISGSEARAYSLGYEKVHGSGASWKISRRKIIEAPCDERPPGGLIRVPLRTVEFDPDSGLDYIGTVAEDFGEQRDMRVVYHVTANAGEWSATGHARRSMMGEPDEITFFGTPPYRTDRAPLWYLLMPVAFVGDLLLLPVYATIAHEFFRH
jgi:hypothetical protein